MVLKNYAILRLEDYGIFYEVPKGLKRKLKKFKDIEIYVGRDSEVMNRYYLVTPEDITESSKYVIGNSQHPLCFKLEKVSEKGFTIKDVVYQTPVKFTEGENIDNMGIVSDEVKVKSILNQPILMLIKLIFTLERIGYTLSIDSDLDIIFRLETFKLKWDIIHNIIKEKYIIMNGINEVLEVLSLIEESDNPVELEGYYNEYIRWLGILVREVSKRIIEDLDLDRDGEIFKLFTNLIEKSRVDERSPIRKKYLRILVDNIDFYDPAVIKNKIIKIEMGE